MACLTRLLSFRGSHIADESAVDIAEPSHREAFQRLISDWKASDSNPKIEAEGEGALRTAGGTPALPYPAEKVYRAPRSPER